MARVDATAAKAAAALAAAQIQVILQDDTVTELAVENKPNHSPLRNLERLFVVNLKTGAVTARDNYIDLSYAGNYPNVTSSVDGQGTRTAPTVSTATLETAAPRNIVITFDAPIYDSSSVSIAGAGSAGKSIASISYAGAVVTITVSADYIAADVVTVSGTFYGAGTHITLADQAITNNIV